MSSYKNNKKNSFNSILQQLRDNRIDFKQEHCDQISFHEEIAGDILKKALLLELCIDHVLNGGLGGKEVKKLSPARLDKLYSWKNRLMRESGHRDHLGTEHGQLVKLGQIPSFNETRQSKSKPKEGLRDLLLWLLSPAKVKILESKLWSEFKIYDSRSPAQGADLNFNQLVPLDSKLVALIEDAKMEYPSKRLSSYDFWHIYLHISSALNKSTRQSERERQEGLMDTAMKQILLVAEGMGVDRANNNPPDQMLLPKLERDKLRDKVLDDAANERSKNFKEYIMQDISTETNRIDHKVYKKHFFRWSYEDTIKRGIYHTEDGWIERNIFARCVMVMSGLDPYVQIDSTDTEMINSTDTEMINRPARINSPAMKCAFELKAVLYEMEGKVARWHALGKYTSSLKIVSKHLREVVDLFILFDKLHQTLHDIEHGTKEQPIIIEEASQGRRKKDLISLNDIALLTSIQPKTILNEAKILQDSPVENAKFAEIINEREEWCWKLYKDRNVREDNSEKRIISMLTTVEKNEIHPNDRESFDSRCYSIRSVIRWILYKQYDLNNPGVGSAAQKMKIPLDWESHEKEFDLGLKELF